MSQDQSFHVLVVGWDCALIEDLWDRIASRSQLRFSYIAPPGYAESEWPVGGHQYPVHFLRRMATDPLPAADYDLLASVEDSDGPTVHNMIMGDRIVSRVRYEDALAYATFLVCRFFELFGTIKPSVVIGGFDGVHSALARAVARRMRIPWFALNFSVIPPGLACLCDGMSPGTRVHVAPRLSGLASLAEASLREFESRKIRAHAYIAPPPRSIMGKVATIPRRILAVHRTMLRARVRRSVQFTEEQTDYSVMAVLREFHRAAKARKALAAVPALEEPPAGPYVFFALHMQPESSIDVWAPFFSNQMSVIELLSRCVPPSHKLLVKIHKSDVSNYSRKQLGRMRSYPGVELVAPFADARRFIERSDLVIGIQGTVGLEAGLLGKPTIMLGDSPVTVFRSVSRIGALTDLPALVRQKLSADQPSRQEIIDAYVEYLAPFMPACHNDWTVRKSESEIDNFVALFDQLRQHVSDMRRSAPAKSADAGETEAA